MAKFDITAAFQAAVGAAGNVSNLDTFRIYLWLTLWLTNSIRGHII